jgi:hypothetical protein
MKALLLPLIAVATLLAGSAGAEMYRWVDENGRVQYSDQPPPATVNQKKEMRARVKVKPAPAAAEAAPTYVDQEAEFRKRQVDKAQKEAAEQKAQEEAAAKQRNCQQARQHLTTLQSGMRITRANAQGEQEYLDDAQIAEELQRAQKAAGEWCS